MKVHDKVLSGKMQEKKNYFSKKKKVVNSKNNIQKSYKIKSKWIVYQFGI